MQKEIQSKFCKKNDFFIKIWFLARTSRASSLTPTSPIPTMDESSSKNAKSIDDLIENLNNTTETTKSRSRKKYFSIEIIYLLIFAK